MLTPILLDILFILLLRVLKYRYDLLLGWCKNVRIGGRDTEIYYKVIQYIGTQNHLSGYFRAIRWFLSAKL